MAIAKEIEGYPEYYVSSAGNVWRKKNNESFMKLRPNKIGQVKLCAKGECKYMRVYRLAAQAFVPTPKQYQGMSIEELVIHHINFNHFDNRTSNLQWLTKAEHTQLHRESEVTFARRSAAKKGQPKPEGAGTPPRVVIQYTKNGDFVAEYASIAEAERLTKVYHGNISNCCSGKRNSAGGYRWSYA